MGEEPPAEDALSKEIPEQTPPAAAAEEQPMKDIPMDEPPSEERAVQGNDKELRLRKRHLKNTRLPKTLLQKSLAMRLPQNTS